jgi:hypothetical protein
MDPELDNLIRTYDRFYKKMDCFKYCKDFHSLFIPDINSAIDGYYQNKLNNEIKKRNFDEINIEQQEKIKSDILEKSKDELDLQDDYIRSVKNNFIKIKDKQYKRKKQMEDINKKTIC